MTGSALGGGVIFVVAVVLWAVVLVPAWVRRREFRVAEQNAARLQRTLRVLAETAEVPHEMRVEATAREAVAHEKMMRSAKRQQEAERAAEIARAKVAEARAAAQAREAARQQRAVERSLRLRRPAVKRVRLVLALATVAGFIGLLIGTGLWIAGSGAALLGWAALACVVGAGGLVALAPGAPVTQPVAEERAPVKHEAPAAPAPAVEEPADPRISAAQHAAAQQIAAQRIARARALARARAEQPTAQAANRVNQPDSMLLAEHAGAGLGGAAESAPAQNGRTQPESARPAIPPAPTAASVGPAAVPASVSTSVPTPAPESPKKVAERARQLAAQARLRNMGVVGDTSDGLPDLDEALRRRRSAG